MFAEFDISSPVEGIPYDAFVRPEKRDKAIHSFVVAECWDVDGFSFFCPTAFDL